MYACAICGKRSVVGRTKTYRGKLKKQGGVGRRTVRVNLRHFRPNLQPATVILNGSVKHVRVCTSCLRSGRVRKAPPTASRRSP